jgi:hypothetical protein
MLTIDGHARGPARSPGREATAVRSDAAPAPFKRMTDEALLIVALSVAALLAGIDDDRGLSSVCRGRVRRTTCRWHARDGVWDHVLESLTQHWPFAGDCQRDRSCGGVFHDRRVGPLTPRLRQRSAPLVRRLLVAGVIGAVLGAYVLAALPGERLRPYSAGYLAVMGLVIIVKAFREFPPRQVSTHLISLAFAGAFIDAIGGEGGGRSSQRPSSSEATLSERSSVA